MALHTISEAARLTGKSRRTLQEHIKNGKLSKSQDESGNPSIDTAELVRVYGEFDATQAAPHAKARSVAQDDAGGAQGGAQAQIELLQLKLAHASQERDTERERRSEAEARERQEREENARLLTIIERQTLLLHPPADAQPAPTAPVLDPEQPATPEARKGFWQWLSGAGSGQSSV